MSKHRRPARQIWVRLATDECTPEEVFLTKKAAMASLPKGQRSNCVAGPYILAERVRQR